MVKSRRHNNGRNLAKSRKIKHLVKSQRGKKSRVNRNAKIRQRKTVRRGGSGSSTDTCYGPFMKTSSTKRLLPFNRDKKRFFISILV